MGVLNVTETRTDTVPRERYEAVRAQRDALALELAHVREERNTLAVFVSGEIEHTAQRIRAEWPDPAPARRPGRAGVAL